MFTAIGRAIRYASLTRKNPEARDFISMGMGIEARRSRCKKFWKQHLELSKQFQIENLDKLPNINQVAILGAGRLFDVPIEYLNRRELDVSLFDADPGCADVWYKRGFIGNCNYDLSANFKVFCDWISKLVELDGATIPSIASELGAFELAQPSLPQIKYDVIISLNLLSQIPLYYHDKLDAVLTARFGSGSDEDGRFSETLAEAWDNFAARLQQQHLELLLNHTKHLALLISDQSYLYYRSDLANWRECKALYLSLPQSECKSSWFWHIAPQGLEQAEYGEIHDVHARAYFY